MKQIDIKDRSETGAMFILRSIGRMIFGDVRKKDLLSLSRGVLYLEIIKKNTPPKKKRIYQQCELRIRRGSERQSYEIVVQKKDSEEQTVFELTKEIGFQKINNRTKTAFKWKNKEGGLYMFVVDSTVSSITIETFHLTVGQCLFERINNKPASVASELELQELLFPQEKIEIRSAETLLEPQADGLREIFSTEKTLFYIFDTEANVFRHKESEVTCKLYLRQQHEFFLSLETDKEKIHIQQVDPSASQHVDRKTLSFVWCYYEQGLVWTFSLQFQKILSLLAFSNKLGECIYELLNKEETMNSENRKYLLDPLAEDIVIDEESAEESEVEMEEEESLHQNENINEENKNKHLVVGYKHDRFFVSRGSRVGVFKPENDGNITKQTVMALKTEQKENIKPTKILLYDQDSSLIVSDENNPHGLYRMDLERGKIVEEWSVDENTKLNEVISDSKYSQVTPCQTMVGLGSSSVFRIDPRVSGNKKVAEETKQYSGRMGFTCGATTGIGDLVLGTEKGDLKLYNKIGKNAKTNLPGFGDPIIGVDVTENGKYIVATCKTYLLIVSTEMQGEAELGFTKRMGEAKPTPKRLQLLPEHAACLGAPVSFTPAKFSTGLSEEKSIVTSTGPFVVTWNFRRVKNGHLSDYQIRKYAEKVVSDNFKFGQDRQVVVALPDHITVASKQGFYKPTQRAFMSKH